VLLAKVNVKSKRVDCDVKDNMAMLSGPGFIGTSGIQLDFSVNKGVNRDQHFSLFVNNAQHRERETDLVLMMNILLI
jgi:hypothetical protein